MKPGGSPSPAPGGAKAVVSSTKLAFGKTARTCLSLLAFWLVGFTFPAKPQGRINDYAGLLDAQQIATLEAKSAAVSRDAGAEAVIAIVPTLDGEPIENVAVDLLKKWGVGSKGKDNGALLVVAIEDRAMRVEVGYGLESTLTDAWSAQTIRQVLTPAFRQQRFYEGFNLYLDTLQARVQGKEPPPQARVRQQGLSPLAGKILFVVLMILFIPVTLLRGLFGGSTYSSYGRTQRRRGPFDDFFGGGGGGGGLGGGGFGGFGGGSSGGGGASGRW